MQRTGTGTLPMTVTSTWVSASAFPESGNRAAKAGQRHIRAVRQKEQPARMARTLERSGAAEGSGHHGPAADGRKKRNNK